MTGEIRKLANIHPEKVMLKGNTDEEISQTVIIAPSEETLNIVKASPVKGADIVCEMEQIELGGKKGYRLTVKNIRKTEGRYMDNITINTDRSELPPLNIPVTGDIKQSSQESSKP